MIVPNDRYECYLCKGRPNYICCEACHETICPDCVQIIWVVRKQRSGSSEEVAHILCKECANVEP